MYVQRENGKIIAAYANWQDYATEWLELDNPELEAFLHPPPPPYTIGADVPWARMTEEEAEIVQAGIDASPVKTRNMINKATSFTEGTDAFNKLKAIISTATSPTRAEEIMGPLTALDLANAEESI